MARRQAMKSPEALHIFFGGAGALRALKSHDFTAAETRTIEAAIASARSANPDIGLLREADAIIERAKAAATPADSSRNDFTPRREEGSISSLSGHFTPPEEREGKPDWDPTGRGLFGYLMWRYRWKHFYAPILTLIAVLILFLVVKLFPTVGNEVRSSGFIGMNTGSYEEAQRLCRETGAELPADPGEILSNVRKMNASQLELGYWLRDGRVYIPKNDTVKARDELQHWFICVER
jgi:hypothetical protein